jgi:hypothetical protein
MGETQSISNGDSHGCVNNNNPSSIEVNWTNFYSGSVHRPDASNQEWINGTNTGQSYYNNGYSPN